MKEVDFWGKPENGKYIKLWGEDVFVHNSALPLVHMIQRELLDHARSRSYEQFVDATAVNQVFKDFVQAWSADLRDNGRK